MSKCLKERLRRSEKRGGIKLKAIEIHVLRVDIVFIMSEETWMYELEAVLVSCLRDAWVPNGCWIYIYNGT